MIINGDVTFKFLEVDKIVEILGNLPKCCVVANNHVGNLVVYKKVDDQFEYFGYVDFLADGEFE